MADEPDNAIPPLPEPRQEKFKEKTLPAEPDSDVKITTASGMVLRERVQRFDSTNGMSLLFTYTRLIDGQVETNSDGSPKLSDPHEICVSAEDSVRVGPDAMKEAILQGREVAVARAVDFFTGIDNLPKAIADIFGKRLQASVAHDVIAPKPIAAKPIG